MRLIDWPRLTFFVSRDILLLLEDVIVILNRCWYRALQASCRMRFVTFRYQHHSSFVQWHNCPIKDCKKVSWLLSLSLPSDYTLGIPLSSFRVPYPATSEQAPTAEAGLECLAERQAYPHPYRSRSLATSRYLYWSASLISWLSHCYGYYTTAQCKQSAAEAEISLSAAATATVPIVLSPARLPVRFAGISYHIMNHDPAS